MSTSLQEVLSCATQLQQVLGDKTAKASNVQSLGRKFLVISKEQFHELRTNTSDKSACATIEKTMELVINHKKRLGLQGDELEQAERYTRAFHLIRNPEEKISNLLFARKANQELLRKWVEECHFPEEAFFLHPDLVDVIFAIHLHHHIRNYGHEVQVNPETKELELLIDGKYQNARAILSPLIYQNELIIDKNDPNTHWCYTEKGLCVRSEVKWTKLEPFATLSDGELQYAQEKARLSPSQGFKNQIREQFKEEFKRFEEGSIAEAQFEKQCLEKSGPCFVLEVVSSWKKATPNPLNSGYLETIEMPGHPWIRLINPEGGVSSVGLYPNQPVDLKEVAKTTKGILRSPDPWETTPYQVRLVTRFAITQEEYLRITQEVEQYQQGGIAFNTLQHNCTRFVQHVLGAIGIEARIETSIGDLFFRLMPVALQRIFTKVDRVVEPIKRAMKWLWNECLPPIVRKIVDFVQNKFKALQNLLVLLLGGTEGNKLDQLPKNPEVEVPTVDDDLAKNTWASYFSHKTTALINSTNDFFDEGLVQLLLPRKMIEWQMAQQRSTTIYGPEHGLHGQYGRGR